LGWAGHLKAHSYGGPAYPSPPNLKAHEAWHGLARFDSSSAHVESDALSVSSSNKGVRIVAK